MTLTGQALAPQSAREASSSQDDNLASLTAASSLGASQAAGRRLGICVITADFWGILKVTQDAGRGARATLRGGGGRLLDDTWPGGKYCLPLSKGRNELPILGESSRWLCKQPYL